MISPLSPRSLFSTVWFGLSLAAAVVCSGCTVERSSLSIDSNSRSPFLGLQFAPPKSKEPVYHRPISRERVKQKSDGAKVELAVEPPRTEAKWSDWLNPLPQRVSQPLPRTESDETASTAPDGLNPSVAAPIEF
ncbi:MAG: hypothetical protein SH850_07475 [Planctomycetaceae bacterium]|nr:hypothetical protein [Planctomycetaceae bacterium]